MVPPSWTTVKALARARMGPVRFMSCRMVAFSYRETSTRFRLCFAPNSEKNSSLYSCSREEFVDVAIDSEDVEAPAERRRQWARRIAGRS